MANSNVLWLGYQGFFNLLDCRLSSRGINARKTCSASEGLEVTNAIKYDLVLLNSDCPAGELAIPRARLEDTLFIGCAVIRQIRRGINKESPIVVVHMNHFVGYSIERALEMYQESGATECFNWSDSSLKEFDSMVLRYL